ncbi:MAG: signal peptidase I [Planctomycetes bacterium]|nr:signal peptidase I [Planctomycetota bacterium]
MPQDDQNEFFGHLSQPSDSGRQRSVPLSGNDDFETVPDPFGDAEIGSGHPLSSSGISANLPQRGRARGRQSTPEMDSIKSPSSLENSPLPEAAPVPPPPTPISTRKPAARATRTQVQSGPGLSPGVPMARDKTQTQLPRSDAGMVLTPSGVQQVGSDSANKRPASKLDIPEAPDESDDFYEQSRAKSSNEDDVSWEEYAADDFPAMAALDFGVKTKTTESGRIVPVAVRADLTDEALKGKSIGDKGNKHKPLPSPKDNNGKSAPKSFFGKVSDSLRLSKVSAASGDTGFAKSGSQPVKTKRTPLGIVWLITSEVGKILILVLVLRAYVVQVSKVRGPSMEGTLIGDERLIVERVTPLMFNNKDEFFLKWLPDFAIPSPKRGDIIVLRSPEDPGSELVKRLIGLPGDELRFEDGHLLIRKAGSADGSEFEIVDEYYLNNESLKNKDGTFRSYTEGDVPDEMDEGRAITVPEGRIFVMGDNRNQSNDSRRWLEIGVGKTSTTGMNELWATESSIEGRVIFRLWPSDRIGSP